jgi:hypothetical protein
MNKHLKSCGLLVAASLLTLASCNKANKNVINFWTGFGASMTTALENVLADYKEQGLLKEGYDVVHTGQGGYDNLLSNITGSVSTRSYPQIAVAYPDHMAQYEESKILTDLSNFIERDGVKLDSYYQDYLQECKEVKEGAISGLPFNKSTEVLTTNKTFVEVLIALTASKTGDDKITGVPQTWQEVDKFGTAAIKVLKELGAFNKVIMKNEAGEYKVYADKASGELAGYVTVIDLSAVGENDFRVLSWDSQANYFITGVRQWNGVYTELTTDAKGNKVGVMRYKSKETAAMLSFMHKLFAKNILGVPSTFGEASYTSTPFKAFKTIFTVGSSAGVSNCVPANNEDGTPKFEVEINTIPYNADYPQNKFVISQGTNLVMLRNTNEESREETWKLLKTLSYDATFNATFAKSSGYIPVTKEAVNSKFYQDYLKDETLKGTAKTMRDAVVLNFNVYKGEGSTWTQFVDPGFVGSSSIRKNIGTVMEAVRDAKDADDTEAKWLELLDSYYQLDKGYIPAN